MRSEIAFLSAEVIFILIITPMTNNQPTNHSLCFVFVYYAQCKSSIKSTKAFICISYSTKFSHNKHGFFLSSLIISTYIKMPNIKLISSIITFLNSEMAKEPNSDTKESLEVAIQCLHSAYDLDPSKLSNTSMSITLEDIFDYAMLPEEKLGDESSSRKQLSEEAEMMKNSGNDLMRSNQYSEALRQYTAAIELDNKNAVYYCNRAAAYSRLLEHQNAIKDCEKAIEIDPKYAKAYGRLGLAYTSIDRHDDAVKAFKKAVELEPQNESYQSNLKLALEKRDKSQQSSSTGGFFGLNNSGLNTLFSNPVFRNIATNIMQDPNTMNALAAGLNFNPNQGASGNNGSSNTSGGIGGNVSGSSRGEVDAGQHLLSQLEQTSPDLVELLRQYTINRAPESQDKKDPPPQ